jgi:hypothetical protein
VSTTLRRGTAYAKVPPITDDLARPHRPFLTFNSRPGSPSHPLFSGRFSTPVISHVGIW